MTSRLPAVRALLASVAVAAAVALAGCQTDGLQSTKHLKPLSPKMLALLEQKQMPKETPILVRIFKEEAELEVWKQDASGRFALLKAYPICRWSGELGPKVKEGDRQAPEGFYNITPAQMNPNSQYYLSFNLGYPNAFDRAHGRTGAHLMVHGDCSSAGCYSMTDDQIAEIYALGRESFFGGQKSFQVQAYPFRMTPLNMAKHRNNPHLAFWKMLKEGYDHFEVARTEPKIDVCEKRYVFNAQAPASGSGQAPTFRAADRCPAYEVDPDLAREVAAKTHRDEIQFAELVRRNTPLAPIRTNTDGGMHPTFLAKYKPSVVRDSKGTPRMVLEARVSPQYTPGETETLAHEITASTPIAAPTPAAPADASRTGRFGLAAESRPTPQPQAASAGGSSGNMFTRLFTSEPAKPDAKPEPKPQTRPAAAAPAPAPRPAAPPRQAPVATQPGAPAKPEIRTAQTPAAGQPAAFAPPENRGGLVKGSQPILPPNSFDSRWGAFR